MIITMIAMRVVQDAFIEIIDMIPMRNRFMTTSLMSSTKTRYWSTYIRVFAADGNNMFIVMSFVRRVQMAVMQIVGVTIMDHCGVSTMRAMNMRMYLVNLMSHVCISPYSPPCTRESYAWWREKLHIFTMKQFPPHAVSIRRQCLRQEAVTMLL